MIRTVRAVLTSLGVAVLLIVSHPQIAEAEGARSQSPRRKSLEEIFGSRQDTAPQVSFDDIPLSDSAQAALNRRKAKRWDELVADGMHPDSATKQVEREFPSEFQTALEKARQDSIDKEWDAAFSRRKAQEQLGRWLWALPLAAFALVVVLALRGKAVKAWIGRLHVGQMIILMGGLMVAGATPFPVALFSVPAAFNEDVLLWLLGFIPVGVISAVLVLWFWFGARAKTKGAV